jgi:Family of unknown function (DUF6151)
MPFDVPLSCRCGRVRGLASEIAPSAGFRLVCYCKDCQAFARFLAHVPEGGAPVFRQGYAPMQEPGVLDAAGGTDIFQMPPAPVKLSAGTDVVRCLSFSGKVLRWYADCCRTPLANTASSPRFPVVALIHSFMDHAFTDQLAHGRTRNGALGRPLCRIYERSAIAPLPPDAPAPASFAAFARRGSKLLGWWWRGLARPSPFFDAHSGAPLAAPLVLTPDERAAL